MWLIIKMFEVFIMISMISGVFGVVQWFMRATGVDLQVGLMLGLCEQCEILFIWSYVYHLDVIAITTKHNGKWIQNSSTYYW